MKVTRSEYDVIIGRFFSVYYKMLASILTAYNKYYIHFRNKYPNTYIVYISILITIFFQGMVRIVHNVFSDNIRMNLCMIMIPIVLLYFGDGRLEEIYNFEAIHKRIATMQYIDNKPM